MDFHLRYRGPLSSNGTPAQKATIREYLSPQLKDLFANARQLKDVSVAWMRLATAMKNGKPDLLPLTSALSSSPTLAGAQSADASVLFYRCPIGNLTFIPLITRLHGLVCELDITFLRREDAGGIVNQGGDLDNRLKTLFDAFRMPYNQGEVGRSDPPQPAEIYCLLEDDILITRVGLLTGRLLGPLHTDGTLEKETDVELHLHVTIKVTTGSFANLQFL